jgi:hypothetical protein
MGDQPAVHYPLMRKFSFSKKGTPQVCPQIVPRTSVRHITVDQPAKTLVADPSKKIDSPETQNIGDMTSTLWKSHGNPINRYTGSYDGGGGFYVVHSGAFIEPGYVSGAVNNKLEKSYSGPVFGPFVTSAAIGGHHNTNVADKDLSSLDADGTTAIALVAPTNPTAQLSSTMAESYREGIPTLPGIQSWKKRTEILRGAGSEYLNYIFGWKPLHDEVKNVVNTARHHRDILQNYHHGEGSLVHRRFDFEPEIQQWEEEIGPFNPITGVLSTSYVPVGEAAAKRRIVVKNERKRWFEGAFTYGGVSKVDSFGPALGYGSDADKLYGTALTPDVLWNLTPWSWAVDWFTNAGDLIHNITNFATAGLVMRYGYMMEETISTYSTIWDDGPFYALVDKDAKVKKAKVIRAGSGSRGRKTVTKARSPANPFGFGVGWEGLSPTQLAITAAIGITRFL